jgi:hypothetical protein
VDSASSVAVVRLTAMRACLPGCPICPTACQIAHLPGTAPLLPALACCVRLSNRPPRGPGPRSAMQRQGGRGSRHNRGPPCPSSPSPRPARSRQHLRSRSEGRALSTHWSRRWTESPPMMLSLRVVLQGRKSGVGSASGGVRESHLTPQSCGTQEPCWVPESSI